MTPLPETLRKAADRLDAQVDLWCCRAIPVTVGSDTIDAMRLGAKALRCHAEIFSGVPLEARATALVEVPS